MKELLETEITIMRDINHTNILHLFEFLQTHEHFYLVLQYCNQGDMENHMLKNSKKYFSELEADYEWVYWLAKI